MSELPEGWVDTEIGAIADIATGSTPPKGDPSLYAREVCFYKPGDLDLGGVVSTSQDMVSHAGANAGRLLPANTLLVTCIGSLGKSALIASPAICNQQINAVLPSPAVEASYLYHWSRTIGPWLEDNSSATTVAIINKGRFSKAPIRIAPLSEQRRIVAKIDSLTGKSRRAREHVDHIPRLVGKYKQAVLAAAFRGDLTREWRAENPSAKWSSRELDALNAQRQTYLRTRRGSRLQSGGKGNAPLPNGWFSAQLSDVGRLQVGYAYKSKWYAADGVRLLRGANVAPGHVSWDDEVKLPHKIAADYADYRLDAGDIVIAMDRPIISTGLKVARISNMDAGCLLVQRVARYATSDLVIGDYVWHLINSEHFIDHAVTQATGSDLPHISANDILTTPVPLPNLSEQKEIVRRVGAAISWIDRLAAESTSARHLIDRLDQTVLAKAFRGELVPQDPDDEPASVLLERIGANLGASPKGKRERKATALG